MTRSFIVVPASHMNTYWCGRAGVCLKPGDGRAWAKKRDRRLQRRQYQQITAEAMNDYLDEIEDRNKFESQLWADYDYFDDDFDDYTDERNNFEDEQDLQNEWDSSWAFEDYDDYLGDISYNIDEHYEMFPIHLNRVMSIDTEEGSSYAFDDRQQYVKPDLPSLADILQDELRDSHNADLIDKNGI